MNPKLSTLNRFLVVVASEPRSFGFAMRLGVGSWRIRERRASGFESDFCKL